MKSFIGLELIDAPRLLQGFAGGGVMKAQREPRT
jgi:hypothetical protein